MSLSNLVVEDKNIPLLDDDALQVKLAVLNHNTELSTKETSYT